MLRLLITSVLLSALLLTGCFSNYTPPESNHTYVTNTQTNHFLTGIRFIHKGSNIINFPIGIDQVSYFIDGRLVAKHFWNDDLETLAQIPPGTHKLVIDLPGKGKESHNIILKSGEIKEFKSYYDNGYYTIDRVSIHKLKMDYSDYLKEDGEPIQNDVEEKLMLLKKLHDQGLIDEIEYKEKRIEILNQL